MRILHLLSQRPECTGSGIYLQNIICEAAAAGHENFLVAGIPLNTPPRLSCLDEDHCSYVTFDGGDLPFPVPGMSDVMPYASSRFRDLGAGEIEAYRAAFARLIRQAVETFRPEMIHTHHLWLMSSLARQLLPDLPMVVTCHSTDLRQYLNCPHLRPMVEEPCRAMDLVMALSAHQAEQIAGLYRISEGRIRVVGGGYDDVLFFWGEKEPAPPVHILYAGKLSRAKGVVWLLRALIRLDDPSVHLHLVGSGSGEEAAECEALAGRLAGRVTLHGRQPQEQLAALLRKSHLFVLPSFYEGLPLVLLEALASGCRVMATDLPGCRELLGAGDPDLVKLLPLPPLKGVDTSFPEDEPGLEALLAECLARQVRRIMASPAPDQDAAARLTSPCNWGEVFARVAAVYEEVLPAHGPK
ncbi:MAG: glycosyltransferase family 4 protein [Desulfobulbaceae bacterium]|jgi:glycosyltransferase involved in cell wall biosynthesis|nr:glycosyltransferase family 4 protein [Desulfobulbaceae bacterium]